MHGTLFFAISLLNCLFFPRDLGELRLIQKDSKWKKNSGELTHCSKTSLDIRWSIIQYSNRIFLLCFMRYIWFSLLLRIKVIEIWSLDKPVLTHKLAFVRFILCPVFFVRFFFYAEYEKKNYSEQSAYSPFKISIKLEHNWMWIISLVLTVLSKFQSN